MSGASGNQRLSSMKPGIGSILIVLLALVVPRLAVTVPTVYIDPPSSHVDPGEEFDVSVTITADADV
jgi:hypothetical protein